MLSSLDHMTITAPSLEMGTEYVRRILGVEPQAGGEHPRMGTHNRFLKLGRKVYLEIIAVNQSAPPQNRPRWFDLDNPGTRQLIRLAAWVARTDDIHAAAAASPVPLGNVELMSRGKMNWLITIPADGTLPVGGIAPILIQWPEGSHPTNSLEGMGCRLLRLEAFHSEPKRVAAILRSIGFEGRDFLLSPLSADEKPYLVAHIQTPDGIRRLSAPASS